MHRIFLICSCVVFLCVNYAQASESGYHHIKGAFDICGQHFEDVVSAHSYIQASKTIKFSHEDQNFQTFADEKNRRIWIFTKPGFKGHPTIVCKEIVEENQSYVMKKFMVCGASKEACDWLDNVFTQHDKNFIQNMK